MNENQTANPVKPTTPVELKDNNRRAKHLITVFWVVIGLTIIAILSGYLELELLKRINYGEYVDENQANASDLRQMIIAWLQTGLYITSAVFFLNWFRRAYGNLHRAGVTHLNHSESMAVWAWFIPIISFFRPVQIMNEIWTVTQEKIKKFDRSYLRKSGGLAIGAWWTLFIISHIVGRFIFKGAFSEDTIEGLINGAEMMILSDFLHIPEALLVIYIVTELSKMETKLTEEVKRSGGNIVVK